MAGRRSSNLAIAFSPTFKKQTTWDVPLAASELTAAFPATSRNWLTHDENVEDVYNCTGEDLLMELVTRRFKRIIIDFDCDPHLTAGWSAFAYGVAGGPSGGINEVQTQVDAGPASAGTFQYEFTHNYNRQLSAPVDFDADAAERQAALEAMPNIGVGNVTVTGVGPFVITFQGALANTDVQLIRIISALVPGSATTVITETTPGDGRAHNFARIAGYRLPFTTLYLGFRGSTEQPVICKNVVVNSIRVRSSSGEKVTVTLELIFSSDTPQAVGFVMPECYDIEPVRFGDCALLVNGMDLYDEASLYALDNGGIAVARDWEYYFQNDILTGPHAFTGRGIDATRFERADRRPSGINYGAIGEAGDTLYDLGQGDLVTGRRTVASTVLRVGPLHNHCTYSVPQGIMKLDSPPITFTGEGNESTLRLMSRPTKITGDVTTPSTVSAVTPQNTAYLIAA